MNTTDNSIRDRLEYLRGEIEAERISYGELCELRELAQYIDPGDVTLLEWAGVPECTIVHDSIEDIIKCKECSTILNK